MNLHYAIVSGTRIASPYLLSSDVEILILYGCYIVCDVIDICQLLSTAKSIIVRALRIPWRKSTVTLCPSWWMQVWISWVGPHWFIHFSRPDMHDHLRNLCHTTVVLRSYEGQNHTPRLTCCSAREVVYLALPVNPRESDVSLFVGYNSNEVCIICAFFWRNVFKV